jgi:DNA-binding IclR family transcriptional regulator
MEHNDLRRLEAPFLHSLCDQYHENVNLSILDDTDVVYVDVIKSSQRVKLAASPEQRLPAFCTGSGKAILAFMPAVSRFGTTVCTCAKCRGFTTCNAFICVFILLCFCL